MVAGLGEPEQEAAMDIVALLVQGIDVDEWPVESVTVTLAVFVPAVEYVFCTEDVFPERFSSPLQVYV